MNRSPMLNRIEREALDAAILDVAVQTGALLGLFILLLAALMWSAP